jgi:glycine dehydrogenase
MTTMIARRVLSRVRAVPAARKLATPLARVYSSTTATNPHPLPPSASFHPAATSILAPLDTFTPRHIGPSLVKGSTKDVDAMLKVVGYKTMDEFVNAVVPEHIRIAELTDKDVRPLSELEFRRRAEEVAGMNKPMKSYIGMGYHNAIVPPVIQRSVSSLRQLNMLTR